ncbi:hypothetical protein MPTK1_3g20120 [Marchantia polymorpha subsp. ruderalis]|uniref:Uncharacterized protein n=2 Tax=Marchantia polymorpha TaxID=3197 RepID=A0AAF6B2T7_MARPO|nr:hypothetical protein MARPO_0049s0021 [Marchantia polymorpha]BBN06321.1 hypothetical protein Mp_3g20120 [Marchantia polymorpha subsp. ruderalis]|eukprot:PTQ38721.1 hypothetical protein MARPO_0049s0021 [Marchantia polymorpha]
MPRTLWRHPADDDEALDEGRCETCGSSVNLMLECTELLPLAARTLRAQGEGAIYQQSRLWRGGGRIAELEGEEEAEGRGRGRPGEPAPPRLPPLLPPSLARSPAWPGLASSLRSSSRDAVRAVVVVALIAKPSGTRNFRAERETAPASSVTGPVLSRPSSTDARWTYVRPALRRWANLQSRSSSRSPYGPTDSRYSYPNRASQPASLPACLPASGKIQRANARKNVLSPSGKHRQILDRTGLGSRCRGMCPFMDHL